VESRLLIEKKTNIAQEQDDFNEWLHLALKLWSDYSAAEMHLLNSLKPTIKRLVGNINSFIFLGMTCLPRSFGGAVKGFRNTFLSFL